MAGRRLATELAAAGFRGRLLPGVPLASYTTWRIGGPAELLALPADREDLLLAVRWAIEQQVPWRILGNGSNLLVRDEGVPGLILRVAKLPGAVIREETRLICPAGALFPAAANQAQAAGLAGIEFGAGIPGTIGGAVLMNAGWHEHEIGRVVSDVEFLGGDGSIRRYDRAACRFRYRGSTFRGRGGVILTATLALTPDAPSRIAERMEAYANSRKANQPTQLPSCGSVFLKPEGDFAGRLIDQAGLRGVRLGDVQISPQHANFFVNLGQATAGDVLELVGRVERTIFERFGVRLVREFELW